MAWYWVALILGLIAPWIIMGGEIRRSFRYSLAEGLGSWFGVSLVTVPMMFIIVWVVQQFL